MDASGLVTGTSSSWNAHECFRRFLEGRAQFPALRVVLCAASPGAGTGVRAVTLTPFMCLGNAGIVLNGAGLVQVPWRW